MAFVQIIPNQNNAPLSEIVTKQITRSRVGERAQELESKRENSSVGSATSHMNYGF